MNKLKNSKAGAIIIKLALYIIALTLLGIYVSAEGIDLKIIQYDADSNHARLQIRNLESKSLKNVSLIVDDMPPYFIVGALSPGNAIVHSRNIPAGTHRLTITTKDGITTSNMLLFQKSKDEIIREQLIQNLNTIPTSTIPVDIPPVEPEKKSGLGKAILIGVSFLIIISIIAFLIWHVNLRTKMKTHRYAPIPIQAMPVRIPSKPPQQIRKDMADRSRRRQELLDRIIKK